MMTPKQLVLIAISGLFVTNAKLVAEDAGRQQRILLHSDQDVTNVMDALAKTQAMFASFNATITSLSSKYSHEVCSCID